MSKIHGAVAAVSLATFLTLGAGAGEAQTAEEAAPAAAQAPAEVPAATEGPAKEAGQEADVATVSKEAPEPVEAAIGRAELDKKLEELTASFKKLSGSARGLYDQRKADKDKDAANIKSSFDQFSSDLDKSQELLKVFRSTSVGADSSIQKHFDTWKAQVAEVQNEKVRKSGEKNIEKAAEAAAKYMEAAKKADGQITRVMTDLEDVRKVLALDLRPGSIGDISGTLDDAADDLEDVQESIGKVREKIKSLPEFGAVPAR